MQFTLLCRVWSGGVNWLLGWWHMVQAMWRGDTWRTMTNSAVAAVADSPVLRPLYTHCTASALSVCQLVVSVRQVIVRLTGAYAVTNAPTLWHSAYVAADCGGAARPTAADKPTERVYSPHNVRHRIQRKIALSNYSGRLADRSCHQQPVYSRCIHWSHRSALTQ